MKNNSLRAASSKMPEGRRWPRQLSVAAEKNILDAAFDVFREHGFGGATTDLIARKAGISKPTLYRRYPNKQALFEQVLYQSLETVKGAFDRIELSYQTPASSLRVFAIKVREINSDVRYIETNRLIIAEAARQPELTRVWRQSMLDEILGRLIAYFECLIERGQMEHDQPDLAARNFLVIFAGSFRPLYGVDESDAERERVFESDLKTFLRGYQIAGCG